MKKFIGIGFITLTIITFFGCGASKVKAQHEHPFKVLEATYTNSAGKQADSIVTKLKISINNKEIKLDCVYFRNHKVSLTKVGSDENPVFIGIFETSTMPHDYILDSDPKQEFGNKPPVIVTKLPFELNDNEAVVCYSYKDKINYFKILEVKEE